MTTLFDGCDDAALDAELMARIQARYKERLLLNPPTPAFGPNNPKAETFAGFATKKDVARFLAVLCDLGLTLAEKGKDA